MPGVDPGPGPADVAAPAIGTIDLPRRIDGQIDQRVAGRGVRAAVAADLVGLDFDRLGWLHDLLRPALTAKRRG